MLTDPPGIPGHHLTEALSKRQPKGASVASLRLFTINRNGVHVRRNTQGRGALDAVRHVHRLLNTGHREVVDADLSNYFGEIPHAELLRSVARRVSDGQLLGWIEASLEMAVEKDDGQGGKRRTNRARRERKATPQDAPISPLFSNIYMRRFIPGWKTLGHAQRYGAEIASYADDFVVCSRALAEATRTAVERKMERLRLPVNARKTRWSFSPTAWGATTARTRAGCISARARARGMSAASAARLAS